MANRRSKDRAEVRTESKALGLLSSALAQLGSAHREGLLAGPAQRLRVAIQEENVSIEVDWFAEPLADSEAARRARIKRLWPSFAAVTTDVGDADPLGHNFRTLALYIAGMESDFGLNRDQANSGPAKGLFQLQANKLRDVVMTARVQDNQNVGGRDNRLELLTNTQSDFADEDKLHDAAKALPNSAAFPAGSPFIALARDNDKFAAMIVRLQLMRSSGPIPSTHDLSYSWWESDWHGPINLPPNAKARFLAQAATGEVDLKALGLS